MDNCGRKPIFADSGPVRKQEIVDSLHRSPVCLRRKQKLGDLFILSYESMEMHQMPRTAILWCIVYCHIFSKKTKAFAANKQKGKSMSQSHANNNKYLMYPKKKIISKLKRKSAVSQVLKV